MASYNNRSLFSDYYLKERVGEDSHWQALKSKAWEFRQRITNILERAVPGINGDTPEAEVERRLIRPILDSLAHVYFVNPAVPSAEGVRRPDYVFFPSPEARQEAESHKGQLEFSKGALAVGDAKAWERSLDKRVKRPGDPFTNHNPSYQIDCYLKATERKWGMLTNGRHWRLYHRDLSYRLDVFYEIDLPELLKLDEEAFLYFLAFFHKEAFQPDGTGECFLDRAYKASTEYAAKVSEELKDNIYEALRLLAEGFLSFPGNSLKPEDLDLIRENAFIAIYRLLFTLYAEAREFLPVSNPIYWGTYSLRALTHEMATKEPFESNLSPSTTVYWSRLRELFRLINNGDEFLRIPPYNGRLFDDEREHQSLAAWRIGDRYLAAAIDQLSRARAAGRTGRGFVSYRDLSIRELGSIYEGLLEHQPRYAMEDMAVLKDGKREKFTPLAELGNRKALKTYPTGSVYLETDKGERKATGSYYTPQYIVEYIVSNTLGPLLEEAKSSDGNPIDAILSLRVMDPAMGSGHFLVEATDYLARVLVEALGGDPREMEEDEIRWARREVVERCIYGVDLNPLAVDLAKLSLWLSTVSLDKPLNFLDHHLRCGNSLIGARLEALGQLPALDRKKTAKATPASQSLLEYFFHQNVATAVDNYFRISAISSDKLQDIQEKEKLYGIARDILKRYQEVAHIWTSAYFGNEVPAEGYMALQDKIRALDPEWTELEKQPWFANAQKMGEEERRFFHWELEFPEVFFDRDGQQLPNAGFSAVVGNPPYVSAWEMTEEAPEDRQVIASLVGPVQMLGAHWDLYLAFLLQGLFLTRQGGFTGFILPNPFAREKYASSVRAHVLRTCLVDSVLSFGETNIFDEVARQTIIPILHSSPDPGTLETHAVRVVLPSSVGPGDTEKTYQVPQKMWLETPGYQWRLELDEHLVETLERIESQALKVGNMYYVNYGAQVSSKDKGRFQKGDVVSTRPGGHAKRFFEGKDLERYEIDWPGLYLDYRPSEMYGPRAPELFESPKIVLRHVSGEGDSLLVALDKEQLYCDHGLVLVTPYESLESTELRDEFAHYPRLDPREYRLEYVLAVLASRASSSYYRHRFATGSLQGSFSHVYPQAVRAMPIRHINFTTHQAEREQLLEQSKKVYEEYLRTKDWSKLLSFAGERLPQKPDGSPDLEREQSDVIHDLLAFLAEEMTRLHKEKQAEVKGFLTWLEGYLGISVEDLKNKTKVKEYWKAEVEWDSFIRAVEQNRRAIQSAKGVDVTRREPQETIQAEFDASVAKLRPLLERIELTDGLIDEIVYKLYGLTEEEIAIVEGRVRS